MKIDGKSVKNYDNNKAKCIDSDNNFFKVYVQLAIIRVNILSLSRICLKMLEFSYI